MADLLESASGRATAAHRRAPRAPRRRAARAPRRAGARARRVPQRDRDRSGEQGGPRRPDRAARGRRPRAPPPPMRSRRRCASTGDLGGVLDLLPARLAEAKDDRTRLALLREAAQLRLEHKHDAPGALADLAQRVPALAARSADREPAHLAREDDRRLPRPRRRVPRGDRRARRRPREAARLRLAYADLLADHLDDPPRAADAYAPGRGRRARQPPRGPRVRGARRASSAGGTRPPASSCATAAIREAFDDELLVDPRGRRREEPAPHDALAAALDRRARASTSCRPRSARCSTTASRRCTAITAAIEPAAITRAAPRPRARRRAHRVAHRARRARARAGHDARSCSTRCAGSPMPTAAISTRSSAPPTSRASSAIASRRSRSCRPCSAARPPRGAAPRAIRSARSVDAVAKWAIDAPRRSVSHRRPRPRRRRHADRGRAPAVRSERRAATCGCAPRSSRPSSSATTPPRSTCIAACSRQAPNDLEVIERLAHLLGLEDRVPELLTLRQIQLGLETDPEQEARCCGSSSRKLVGIVEERGGRLDALKANLEDRPGHEASIDAVADAAREQGPAPRARRPAREPGPAPRDRRRRARAPRSCGRATRSVAETDTKEIERAIAGHRRVVALAPTQRVAARARAAEPRARPAGAGRAVARELARHRAGRRAAARRVSSSRRRTCRRTSPTARSPRSRSTSTTRSRRSSCARCSPTSTARPMRGSRSRAT